MEDHSKTTDSVTKSASMSSDINHLSHPPDVPEDIDDEFMNHFNDPNWDFQDKSSTLSISTDGAESQRWSKMSGHTGADTEVNTDSHISSWHIHDPMAEFSLKDQIQDSPYPEVRAAVANTDDPTIPVNTFRVWFLGILFSAVIPAFNTVISLRFPYVTISVLFTILIALPLGKLLEWILPKYRISVLGYSFSLNPGPFNLKEHALIAIMANIVVEGSSISDVASALHIVYGIRWSIGKRFLLGLPIQIIGFSFAGVLRQFLVWPSSMIWPGVLVRCALLNAMHSNYGKKDTKHISRERFFYLACICSFVWYWVPGYLWTGLSVFNWVCWIAPNNVVVNNLFGTIGGFGMGLFTLDWAQISAISSPLVVPFWAQLNMMGGFLIVIWIICPIMWAKNVWYSQYMPPSVGIPFDNTGGQYNLSAIITNHTFDQAKYEQYSPLFLPITYAVTYGTIFATYPAILVHTCLWYHRDISHQFRRNLKDEKDIHSRLMSKYPEVPHWWFLTLGIVSLVMGIIGIEVCDTKLTVWAFFISLVFAAVFVIPFGILQAISSQSFTPVVLAEMFYGYIFPGRPLAMMIFKIVAGNTGVQAILYSGDQKFGHYMKIPPRLLFSAQVIATIITVLSGIMAQEWAINNIPDLCSPHQKHFFTCPNINLFNTGSIIWGGIGPRRIFSPGAIYSPLMWFFLIGAIAPIPFYYLARRYPRTFWRYINIPIVLFASTNVPPANGINYSSWFLVGIFFQWFMKRHHFRWWLRYNYPLAAGLDAGVIIGLVVIFFSLQMRSNGGINVNWWGNSVWKNTADAHLIPLKTLTPGERFGPSVWS